MAKDWYANCIDIIEKDIRNRKKTIEEYEREIESCDDPERVRLLTKVMNIQKETMLALETKMPEAKKLL